MTIRERILNIVEKHADQTFLVDATNNREITYREFHHLACTLAAELRNRNIRHGDRVGIMIPNCCELAILYFACMYLGVAVVPINPNLSAGDVGFILSSCRPQLLIASPSCIGRVGGLYSNSTTLLTAQEPAAAHHSDALAIDALPESSAFVPLDRIQEEDLLAIVYTSGTTAKPKGLAHKFGSIFRNATAFATTQGIDHASRFYSTLSMAYMGGLYNLLILPFLRGASVVVDRVFDARSSLNFWDKAIHHQVNALWLAPTVMSILMKMDRGHRGEEFCRDSVSLAFVGFAPLPFKLKEDFEARYGLRVIESYGLTEALFVTARSRMGYTPAGYVGEPLTGIKLRVVGESGLVLPPGGEGELHVLSPDLMAGFLDEEGALQRANSLEWFPTGDFGRLDHSGSLFITGRKKDIIIRGGINISPAAIEEVLSHSPGASDVAVVSIPHELYGEDVVAVLKLEPGVELESILETVMALAKRDLAVHQQPARYVAIDEFPRTANGKVQKARLRELVLEKLQIGSGSILRPQPVHVGKI